MLAVVIGWLLYIYTVESFIMNNQRCGEDLTCFQRAKIFFHFLDVKTFIGFFRGFYVNVSDNLYHLIQSMRAENKTANSKLSARTASLLECAPDKIIKKTIEEASGGVIKKTSTEDPEKTKKKDSGKVPEEVRQDDPEDSEKVPEEIRKNDPEKIRKEDSEDSEDSEKVPEKIRQDESEEVPEEIRKKSTEEIQSEKMVVLPIKDRFVTAVLNGNLELVKQIIDQEKLDVSSLDFCDESSLVHVAVKSKNVDVINHILKSFNKYDAINVRDVDGNTPLDIAIVNDDVSMVELLSQFYMFKKYESVVDVNPLHVAVKYNCKNAIQWLLNNVYDTDTRNDEYADSDDNSLLCLAVECGNIEMIQYLIDSDFNPDHKNKKGDTILHIAAREGRKDVVQLLLCSNDNLISDVNVQNNAYITPLQIAAESKSTDTVAIVSLLLEYGADIHRSRNDGSTPFIVAVRNGNLPMVQLLFKAGARDTANNKDKLALVCAVEENNTAIAKWLLCNSDKAYNGDDNLINTFFHDNRNDETNHVLFLAVENNNLELVKLLIQYDADVAVNTNNKTSLLHMAVSHGHLNLVKYFIDEHTDIFKNMLQGKDRVGNEAINLVNLAIRNGRSVDLVKFLLNSGCYVDYKNIKNITIATGSGYKNMTAYITALLVKHNEEQKTENC